MDAYVFALSVDNQQTYVEEVLAGSNEDAALVAYDALVAVADAYPWTLATLTASDGRVQWLATAGKRED